MMPQMNGIELIHEVLQRDAHVVGIIMTGAGTIASAVEAMKVGALDYILKPFTLRDILPVLSRGLTVRKLRVENAELMHRLQNRTRELESTNKSLESFSFSVSHDLRAPLRIMGGFATVMAKDHAKELSPAAIELLQDITKQGLLMGQLIDDLLKFSRAGLQPLSKQPVDMSTLLHAIVAEERKAQLSRTVDITYGDLPVGFGDPALLRQVFINLISNAFKYTSKRPDGLISISSQRDGAMQVFTVADNGIGFDMRHAKKLFGVFSRLHRPEEFEGTGVGLSIVKQIIERHGGTIIVQAEPNKGASFSVALPIASDDALTR
jgi:light-regulated signal transduction histidine kinase (bacteriophytochrome)